MGRPRVLDHSKIYELKAKGLSDDKVAESLGISRGAVQYALWRRGRNAKGKDQASHVCQVWE